MKATEYKIETCVLDKDDTIHAILTNVDRGVFVPLYISKDHCSSLLDMFKNGKSPEQSLTWDFINSMWEQLGFEVRSIVIDHQGHSGTLIPGITLVQNQFGEKFIHITMFIPIGAAILMSSYIDVPIYLTERAEAVVKKVDIKKLLDYISETDVLQENK